jgi:hypothetical protein
MGRFLFTSRADLTIGTSCESRFNPIPMQSLPYPCIMWVDFHIRGVCDWGTEDSMLLQVRYSDTEKKAVKQCRLALLTSGTL